MGDTVTGNLMERSYRTCHLKAAGDGSSWIWLADGGLLYGLICDGRVLHFGVFLFQAVVAVVVIVVVAVLAADIQL